MTRRLRPSSRCRAGAGAIPKPSPRRYGRPYALRSAPRGTRSPHATCTCSRCDRARRWSALAAADQAGYGWTAGDDYDRTAQPCGDRGSRHRQGRECLSPDPRRSSSRPGAAARPRRDHGFHHLAQHQDRTPRAAGGGVSDCKISRPQSRWRHSSRLLRGRRYPRRAGEAQGAGRARARRRRGEDRRPRQAGAVPAPEGFLRHVGRDRTGVRTPADECRQASDAPASPPTFTATVHSQAKPIDVAANFDRDLFHHLVGGAVRGSSLGRAQPTGTRGNRTRQRSRRAGDSRAQAQARLDDNHRGYRVRALVCRVQLPADGARRARRATRHSAALTARRAWRARAIARGRWRKRNKNRAGPTTLLPRRKLQLDATLTARVLCCRSRRLRLRAGLFLPRLGPRGRWRRNWLAPLDLAYSTLSDLAWLVIKVKRGLAM